MRRMILVGSWLRPRVGKRLSPRLVFTRSTSCPKDDDFAALYATPDSSDDVLYEARCECGTVRYAVTADPVDSKICHCHACQRLHGAPMQWAAIFHKHHVRFTAGVDDLCFYNSETGEQERVLPCKVSCSNCGTRIADEGRNMWLAFPSLFEFGFPPRVPEAFRPSCHIFYGARTIEVDDGLPKWSGHKNKSKRLDL